MAEKGETALMLEIRDALLATGRVVLWRNQTGQLKDARGRWVRFGIGVGGADLVGIVKGSGRFFACEVKTTQGKVSPEQEAWHRAVTAAGGLAIIARSVAEALAGLGEP